MIINRRNLIGGLATLIAAPAIIRVADLMPIRMLPKLLVPTFPIFSYEGTGFNVGDKIWVDSPGFAPGPGPFIISSVNHNTFTVDHP